MQDRAVALITTHEIPKAQLSYNWEFDRNAYNNLAISRPFLTPYEYQRKKDQLDGLTVENLKSDIRERFCALEYQTSYTFQNGQLVNSFHDEPFSQIIKNGIAYRAAHGSTDTIREQAELTGFEHIEQMLRDGKQTVVSMSPKGGSYPKNYFDIHRKNSSNQVDTKRFTSTLSYEGFFRALQNLDPSIPQPIRLTDDFFLSHPVQTHLSLEEILETIELDKKARSKKEVELIVQKCLPLIFDYVAGPTEKKRSAILNFADALGGYGPKNMLSHPSLKMNIDWDLSKNMDDIMNFFGAFVVRQVETGCGISQSGNRGELTFEAWSVSDFGWGHDHMGTLKIHCETCGATYSRNYGRLESNCRVCRGTKGIVC